jgi:hypothetical protein
MSPKLSLADHPFTHVLDPVPQGVFLKVPWLTLAPFGLPSGALGLTLAHPGGQFPHFWDLLAGSHMLHATDCIELAIM